MRLSWIVTDEERMLRGLPWWARAWRRDTLMCGSQVAAIPLCWLLRQAEWAWQATYAVRPTQWEKDLRHEYELGYAEGHLRARQAELEGRGR